MLTTECWLLFLPAYQPFSRASLPTTLHGVARMRRVWIAALSMGLLLLLPACGGGGSSPQPPPPPPPPPPVALTQLSADTFTNPQSQHATEVEPGIASSGSTLVTAFQVGRIYGGGSAAIGFATSTNAGASWSNGYTRTRS